MSKIKEAVAKYQCPGCARGPGLECYEKGLDGVECANHEPATYVAYVGKIFLGLPKGFNRLGPYDRMPLWIYEKCEDFEFDKFNVPVWKTRTEEGYTLVRGMMPRLNRPFIILFLEDCMDKVDCIEITKEDIDYMDQ